MTEVTIPVTFKLGKSDGLKWPPLKLTMEWLSSNHEGARYDLVVGAGLGNTIIRGVIKEGETTVYAEGDISGLARQLFAALKKELDTTTEDARE